MHAAGQGNTCHSLVQLSGDVEPAPGVLMPAPASPAYRLSQLVHDEALL